MGSTLSFPILCMVNLACYWQALEEYLGQTVRMEDLPVLINGDDILFRANEAFYQIWKQSVSDVGFTLSLGKNYFSKNYLTVNSLLYRYTQVDLPRGSFFKNEHVFSLITYLNTGHLTGQSKLSGRTEVRTLPLWDLANGCVPSAVNPARAHRRFVHYHRQQIQRATEGGLYSLFLPHQRGGLGFTYQDLLPHARKGVVRKSEGEGGLFLTPFQRRFASYCTNEFISAVEAGKEPKMQQGIVVKSPGEPSSVKIPRPYDLRLDLPGPVPSGWKPFSSRILELPFMSVARKTVDLAPELRFKHPSRAVKRSIRSGSVEPAPPEMQSKRIFTWPYVLLERTESGSF